MSIADALIVVGILLPGVGVFRFVSLPSILALTVLYPGVFSRRLETDLEQT